MSRPLRIEFANAWYHVMTRGAARQKIMKSAKDAQTFVKLLEKISDDYGIEIHSYCLMGNHYHLLVRTPYANLSDSMRHLNSMYTRRFNRLEKRDGPLFRGQFKSIIVDAEDYWGFPHEERNIAMLIAKQAFGYQLQAIGNAFGQIKYNTVSASICLAHNALEKNPLLAEKAEMIKTRLSKY